MLASDLTTNLNCKAYFNIYLRKIHGVIAWSLHSPVHKTMALNYLACERALPRYGRRRVNEQTRESQRVKRAGEGPGTRNERLSFSPARFVRRRLNARAASGEIL